MFSTMRFTIHQSFILTDYLVREMTRVIDGLTIDEKAVARNLELSNESILSEYIITLLTKAGLERPKAHEKLRALSHKARETGRSLLEIVGEDAELSTKLESNRVNLDEYYYTIRETSGHIIREAEEAYQKTRR